MNPDQIAFALVMAVHHGYFDQAEAMIVDLLEPVNAETAASVLVDLAMALNQAWIEQCETDGVPFDEFSHHAGNWLAERLP
jgi:UDP-N-acetyl-D-mannosaminuronic acid transferase (WecB/TagA/CpsF family)